MISCANKILSRSNNILSRRNKLKNKTRMSLPGFRTLCTAETSMSLSIRLSWSCDSFPILKIHVHVHSFDHGFNQESDKISDMIV